LALQRSRSVMLDEFGDTYLTLGDLDQALKAYRDDLAIAERLAAADRSNTQWQRDLSVSYEKVGDVLVAQGKLDEALQSYRDSLGIRERLAAVDRLFKGRTYGLSCCGNSALTPDRAGPPPMTRCRSHPSWLVYRILMQQTDQFLSCGRLELRLTQCFLSHRIRLSEELVYVG
jgi:tetratricopeptide (TPR) repeat protein